jgi:hypothetical protein
MRITPFFRYRRRQGRRRGAGILSAAIAFRHPGKHNPETRSDNADAKYACTWRRVWTRPDGSTYFISHDEQLSSVGMMTLR